MSTRLTVYMDPYGRFFLSERRGGYPVTVELTDGYRVVEDPTGNRVLVGHESPGRKSPTRFGWASPESFDASPPPAHSPRFCACRTSPRWPKLDAMKVLWDDSDADGLTAPLYEAVLRSHPGQEVATIRNLLRSLDARGRFELNAVEALCAAAERVARDDRAAAEGLLGDRGTQRGPNAQWFRAKLWTALGETRDAITAWNEVVECGLGPRVARYLARARLRIGIGEYAAAAADLREALRDPVSYDDMERACKVLRRLEGRDAVALRKCKIALLGNFTTKLIRPLLELAAFRDGVDAEIYEAEYGLVHQEVLDKTSGLHSFRPDLVILATSWRDANLPVVSDDPDAAVSCTVERFSQLWRIIGSDLGAHTIQHNFDIPFVDSYGHLSSALAGGRARIMRRVNLALLEAAGPTVTILDFDGVASRFGKAEWADEGNWYRFKQHPSAAALPGLVDEYMMHVRAVLGLNKKVLVLDLDNTVWGGIVGEDGLEGLKVGVVDPEGEAHTDLQRYAKELKERGVVLAVCSKNNEADAREPFVKHPEMVLKQEDIAAFVANWQDKATNLRDIAKTLELGLDSFVFLDDNPTERAWVRSQLPQVTVPDIGDDPSFFLAKLQHARCFEALTLTDEDRARSADYAAQSQRANLMKSAGTIEEFIRNLQMAADVLAFDDVSLPRIAQLVNKSNQFNLTTRRRTEQQLKVIGASENHVARAFRLRDRFADNGLIGVMIGEVRRDDASMEIDTWLMSCRVLGRRVEEFMCSVMMRAALGHGLRRILGRYIPTAKNALVKDLYSRLGFEAIGEGPSQGETVWQYDLTSNPIVTNDLIFAEADAARPAS